MKRIIKKTALLLCAAMLFCPLLASCSKNKDENNIPEDECVLKANGHDVSYGLYRYFFLNHKENYKEELKADAAAAYSKIEAEVFEDIKGHYAMVDLCAENGISVDSPDIKAEVDKTVNSIKEQYIDAESDPKGEKGFAENLKANFMTEEVLRFMAALDACERALFTKLVSEGKIVNDTETIKAAVEGEEFIRVVQIYIDADNGASRDENKALADSVHAKAVGGADFDELIGSYSNDYSMTKDGYYICRGYMNEQFEELAFSLKAGEISRVLETEDGFHIIKRLEKDAEYLEKNYDRLAEQYQSCIFYEQANQRARAMSVTKTEKFSQIDPSLISLG